MTANAQTRRRLVLGKTCLDPCRLEARQHVANERQESTAAAGKLDRMRAAIDEVDADPLLERSDVPAQRRLRDGARFRGPRKAAALRERHEVLEPFDVERSVVGTHGVALNSYMRF